MQVELCLGAHPGPGHLPKHCSAGWPPITVSPHLSSPCLCLSLFGALGPVLWVFISVITTFTAANRARSLEEARPPSPTSLAGCCEKKLSGDPSPRTARPWAWLGRVWLVLSTVRGGQSSPQPDLQRMGAAPSGAEKENMDKATMGQTRQRSSL
jgi:hypothetical protein